MGQHGDHLGPVGPSWAPCWPHEPSYQGYVSWSMIYCHFLLTSQQAPNKIQSPDSRNCEQWYWFFVVEKYLNYQPRFDIWMKCRLTFQWNVIRHSELNRGSSQIFLVNDRKINMIYGSYQPCEIQINSTKLMFQTSQLWIGGLYYHYQCAIYLHQFQSIFCKKHLQNVCGTALPFSSYSSIIKVVGRFPHKLKWSEIIFYCETSILVAIAAHHVHLGTIKQQFYRCKNKFDLIRIVHRAPASLSSFNPK